MVGTRHPPQGHGRAAGIDQRGEIRSGAGEGSWLRCLLVVPGFGPWECGVGGEQDEATRPWEAMGAPPQLLLASFF